MLDSAAINFYFDHPVEFVEDVIGVEPEPEQQAIMRSVANNPMTTVRSGHGVGKSATASWLLIWFLVTHPFPKIPCTAPTQHQLFDILWAEVSKWIRRNPALEEALQWSQEKIYLKGYREEWFAVARSATKPDALQGFHADHVLYIVDEASGVDDKIFEPILGALSTEGAKLVMFGNPTRLNGFFHDSHTKSRAQFSALHVDGRTSRLVSQAFVDNVIEMFGEDSDVFRVRVAGEFPSSENQSFIRLPIVEAATKNKPNTAGVISFGVDVARYGDDDTVIALKVGNQVTIPAKRHGQNLMQTVGDIVRLYRETLRAWPRYRGLITVNIDDTGLGGGVTDRLEEVVREQKLRQLSINPVNFGARVPDKNAAENYDNMSTWLWGTLREDLRLGKLVLPNDSELIAQLSARKYQLNSSGKIVLESKDAMKKRGISSPDIGDAVALACYDDKYAYDIRSMNS